jgi:hypothetical protein
MSEHSTVLDEGFDTDSEKGTPPRELLPADKYPAEIVEATVAPLKTGNGRAVNLRWSIAEGDFEARLVFQSIIIEHTNEKAKSIGRAMLKDICVACDVTGVLTDLEVLKYKLCHIRVGIERDKTGQYPDKNRVTRVDPYVRSWNGERPAAETLKEATTTRPAFKASNEVPDDAVPF